MKQIAGVHVFIRRGAAGEVRARVEHVFAQQRQRLARSVGKGHAAVKIGLMSIAHNMRRWAYLVG